MWKNWTPAFRRYQLRALVSMAAYVGVLFGAAWLFAHHPPQGALKYVLAAVPAAPLIAVIASLGLFLKEETDEFQRALMVEQILLGTGATLVIASVWGSLEMFAGARRLEAYWVVIVWFATFGLARCVRLSRYR